MKQFKPKMTDGMGNAKEMAPEAHNEWADKEGKHSAVQMGMISDSDQTKKSPVAIDKRAIHKHEVAGIAKGKHSPAGGSPFKGASSAGKSGFPIGPKQHAGKGSEGVVKGMGGAGKLNYGNGLKAGKKVKGL